MRSSKSRSRSKSNRQRSIGNIVNRVFDSSGPEGKVRGTPQQIIDKYLALARDAQLSNDRVAEQNFLQHAEHYTRMLGEAQRELQREQEQRQAQQAQQGGGGGGGQGQPAQSAQPDRGRAEEPRREATGAADVIDTSEPGESTLVETPESAPAGDQPAAAPAGAGTPADASGEASGSGERDRAPRRERRPRGPRKPKAQDGEAPNPEPSAAE